MNELRERWIKNFGTLLNYWFWGQTIIRMTSCFKLHHISEQFSEFFFKKKQQEKIAKNEKLLIPEISHWFNLNRKSKSTKFVTNGKKIMFSLMVTIYITMKNLNLLHDQAKKLLKRKIKIKIVLYYRNSLIKTRNKRENYWNHQLCVYALKIN